MEQMYLIEMFIDKVTIFASDEDAKSGANKNLIIKLKFGPKNQFIIKEGQMAPTEKKDDIIECDSQGRRKWTRTIRVGKSFLFPSYPDTVLMILSNFPLEIEVWNDDENEVEIFVGIGTMHWDTQFYFMLKETADACKPHDPLSIKQVTPLFAECCCRQVGEIAFILRISALGESITTEFQQLMNDPDVFVFRTDKAPSMFQCKRIEGDDPNFCMVGSLYETTTLEDPEIVNNAQKNIEVCTELQSCAAAQPGGEPSCIHETDKKTKSYPIDKIKMGDITGPCGNANCPLAHKVRMYIRNLDVYKSQAGSVKPGDPKDASSKKICGSCSCKDDRWHRGTCSEKKESESRKGEEMTEPCAGCGGKAKKGDTCEERQQKLFGTGATPKGSKTKINYLFTETKVPDYKKSLFGRDYIVENAITKPFFEEQQPNVGPNPRLTGCCCQRRDLAPATVNVTNSPSNPFTKVPEEAKSSRSLGNNNLLAYNLAMATSSRNVEVYNCTDIPVEKDCKCAPPKPTPPCKAFDCDCLDEINNVARRKSHRPYCPSFKHKNNCPVTMLHEEEEKKKNDDDEDETEPLPYGLPPIKLGPCPILGKPCTYPDGFARMYKVGALAALPPSYSEAGKVCCSKEYERIKSAISEYLHNEKDHDARCVNQFNVDTERRCCDNEQKLFSLTGKSCCGSHKMAIQEKFKDDKK